MPDDEAQEMYSQISRPGNFLIITITKTKSPYDSGAGRQVRVKEREHWFFKVESVAELRYRPYNAGPAVAAFKQQEVGSQIPYLEPEEGTIQVPLVNVNGNDILRNNDDDWLVYHASVSPLQEDIRVYPQIPESQPGGGFTYLGSQRPAAVNGDPVGYIDGNDNPSYYNPTAGLAETLVWNTGGSSDASFQFYNSNPSRRKIPKLNISGAAYTLTPVEGDEVMRNLLDAASNNDPAVHQVTWGPIRESFSYDVPDQWDDSENYITEVDNRIPERFKGGE